MDDRKRAELLQQVNRQSATVGATIPDTIPIQGTEIELAEFIIETRGIDQLPPESETILSEAKRTFREARADRVEQIESAALDREEAETLADEIVGIDRALNALETIRHPDFGDQAKAVTIDDHKRWLGFVEELT